MDKLKLHTPDLTKANIDTLAALFPHCVVEAAGENGALERRIDFDLLRQELSNRIVEGPVERYQLNWPGKREALLAANAPIAKTLRPCREESVDFDATRNLFIEGDNLDALKLLQETYLGKVKMIYIDPPYNTGNDFIYDDDFAESSKDYFRRSNQKDADGAALVANTEANGRFHSDWLSMMYPRLKLARNLLRDDGSIWVSIDDNELNNLINLGEYIFGNDNFVSIFIWQKRKTRENRKVFSVNHDYIICFAKNKNKFEEIRKMLPLTDEARARYSNPDNDPRGVWQSVSINAQADAKRRKEQFYTIVTPGGRQVNPPSGRCWLYTEDRFNERLSDNRIWFGEDGNNVPREKMFLSEQNPGLTPHTLWLGDEVGTTDSAKRQLNELFDDISVFDTPKPIDLLSRITDIANTDNDIVIDFFSGSSPLAEAVLQMNANSAEPCSRRFIMVQLPEACDDRSEAFKAGYKTISDIGKERIRRAGRKLREGNVLAQNLDIGFRVLKVDSSNMLDVYYTPDKVEQGQLGLSIDNIKPDRTPEDLLFHVLLDWGVDLTLPITRETLSGKTVFVVDENALAACFELGVTEELVKQIAARKPLRAVFRDAGFANDAVKVNVAQIFKLLSPTTDVKVI